MNIHEYQAKALLAQFGVAVPKGVAAKDPAEFEPALAQLDGANGYMVKSQIHAGGRGKGTFTDGLKGGVKFSATREKALENARAMLGKTLVTAQTGPEGRKVQALYFTEAANLGKRPDGRDDEYYLAVLLDRATSRPVIVASTEGGVEIEQVAHDHPERITKVRVDPAVGLQPYQARQVAFALGFKGDLLKQAVTLVTKLYRFFWEKDCAMVEINPLLVTKEGRLVALDAKVSFDDNALFRHPDIVALRDLAEEDPKEVEASKFGLSYIALDGNIACLVNGAGLAMSTMDIIQHFGGSPANFLDVGGGASKDQVTAAFKIILGDPNVKGILVNIFGGIMDCDIIAQGIVAAARETGLDLPLVVRLEGNNVAAGKATLAASGLKLVAGDSMADAARKIVALVGKA
jgi:succinyl-CoA synthetase beta subunit